jgi:hypothetical protein
VTCGTFAKPLGTVGAPRRHRSSGDHASPQRTLVARRDGEGHSHPGIRHNVDLGNHPAHMYCAPSVNYSITNRHFNTSREFQKMPRFVAAVPLLVAVTGCLIQQVHAAEFKRNAAGIEITGEVVPGDDARFKSIISTMPAGGFVYLESPGGSALTAIAIGRLIRARRLNTSITAGTCASACGIIWLAGVGRHIGPTGKVGFHAAYNGVTLEQSGFANALIGAYLNELHLSDRAIIYITHKAPNDMQWLTAADATAVGIPAELDADPSDATTPSPGTYERKWVDSCMDATREERSQKGLPMASFMGFADALPSVSSKQSRRLILPDLLQDQRLLLRLIIAACLDVEATATGWAFAPSYHQTATS